MSQTPHYDALLAGTGSGTEKRTVVAPYDQSAIASIAVADAADHELALTEAHAMFRNRSAWLSVTERVAVLRKAAQIMRSRHEELAQAAAAEGGKPLLDSQVEVSRAIDGLDIAIESIRSEQGHVVPTAGTNAGEHHMAFTQREPIGVVVAVSAFNHPLNLIVHQVGAAVAAGCPVIVKPADDTPISCWHFVSILREAGLPDAACQMVVSADHTLAELLVTDPRVAFFSFIGSARVGWMLRSKLAPGTRCALEHGGAAPLILAADGDQDAALASVLKGGFYHAGQVCVSVQRVFAERSIARQFAERLAEGAAKLCVGDPTLTKTEVGPLIRPAEVQRVDAWLRDAQAEGAECLTGGAAIGDTCYEPTVLFEPPATADVSTKEIFGPVVCVYAYDDIEQAIEQANSLPVAFQAAIFTAKLETALQAYKGLDASAVMVNQHTAFRIDGMPFAGLRESGLGVGGIPHSIADMSIEKMMVIRSDSL